MVRKRRERGPDFFDLIKLIVLLAFLFALGGFGMSKQGSGPTDAILGGFVKALWGLVPIFIGLIVLAVLLAILANVFRRMVEGKSRGDVDDTKVNTQPARSIIPVRVPEPKVSSTADDTRFAPPETRFTLDLLEEMEWRRFEMVVLGYFQALGYAAERSRAGADGGVDIIVRKISVDDGWTAYVQCKAWRTYNVGVKPVRELFGVMAGDGVTKGYFMALGTYSAEAHAFATGKELYLVTGADLLSWLNDLNEVDRTKLYRTVTEGDFSTPTCPSCDIKMVRKDGKNGEFWGCPNYGPKKCKQTFPIRERR